MRRFTDRIKLVAAIATVLGLIGAIGLALGYKTPQQALDIEIQARTQIEADVSALKEKYHGYDVKLAIFETKINDIHDGMEEMLGHKLGGKKQND